MNSANTDTRTPTLILGTVQLGMPYGIANTSGKPERHLARQIIKTALDNNITFFDTAQAYGDSESVLGAILQDLGVADRVYITSKVSAALNPLDNRQIDSAIRDSFKRLGVDHLWCMLLHQPSWLACWDDGLGSVLQNFHAAGQITRLGISLNTVNDAAAALAHPDMETLQAPCNGWDRRMVDLGFLNAAQRMGRLCSIRSIYLQGLLTMTPEAAAAKLPAAWEASVRWWSLASEFGISPKELAFRYALSLNAPLVVGAESPEQVAETAQLANRAPLTPEDIHSIAATMNPVLDETIIEPWRWKVLNA